jgi:hypothetical protein
MRKKKVAGDYHGRPPGSAPRDDDHFSGGASENDSGSVASSVNTDESRVCPVCDGTLYINWRLGRYSGKLEPFYLCFPCVAELDHDGYNEALRQHGVEPWRLKKGDFRQLGPPLSRRREGRRKVDPPPSIGLVGGWHSRLQTAEHQDVLRWLTDERGLTLETIKRYRLGYDGEAVVFPVYDAAGSLVYVKRRYWPSPWFTNRKGKKVWKRTPDGVSAQLYPNMPRGAWLLLCEGELDALLARQHRLPAVTTTCGVQLPDELVPRFAGRDVAVAYDHGGQQAGARTAEKLRLGEARAWAVDLGLPNDGDDLTDWFLTYGRTRARLIRLIRRAS